MSGAHTPTYTPEQRAEVIRRYELGHPQQAISEATKVKKSTVDAWIQTHKRQKSAGEYQPNLPLSEQVSGYVDRVSVLTHRAIHEMELSGSKVDPGKLKQVIDVLSQLDKIARNAPEPPKQPDSAVDRLAADLPS